MPTVAIRGNRLVIEISLPTLVTAFDACPEFEDDDNGENIFIVTNQQEFIKSVRRALTHEQEDGTTIVHEMFDRAFVDVVEQGMEGVDERAVAKNG